MTQTSLLSELRRKIQDVRPSRRALSFGLTDENVTSAVAEVTNGHLIVNVAGGTAPAIDFDLTNARYDTIGKLYQVLSRTTGYTAQRDEDANLDHPSIDVEPFGPLDVRSTGVDLNHHLFSDNELEEVLREAIQRHNPSLSTDTLPPQEWAFIFPLAQANICRIQAYDASKRKALDMEVNQLLALADSFERRYKEDTTRLARALQSPRETNSNIVDEGDVMLGKQVRRSLRTGFMSPTSQTLPPEAAVLLDPDEHDVEDDNARIVWQRNKNYDFYSYELWMDSRPDVVRTREGGLIFAGTPVAFLSQEDGTRAAARRLTTSQMVFRSFGGNSNSSRSSFSTFVEEFGQLISAFSVGNLESETEYYFRLYIITINYVATSSNVVRVYTKPLRARFLPLYRPDNQPGPTGVALSANAGPPGTVVTVQLDPTKGAFTTQHVFRIGEKVVTPSISGGGYVLSFTVPTFQIIGIKDVSIVSPTQLVSVINQAFTVTS